VAFDAGQFGKVTSLELWVNDRFYAATQVDTTTPRGTFNLDLDTLQLQNGQHSLKVKALSGRKVIGTDVAVVTVTNGGVDVVPPLVSFRSPMDGDAISGVATIDLSVSDNDRVSIVSLFANKLPLMLKSSPPYTYSLDTTTLPTQDGKATLVLEAMAIDRSENVGRAKAITVTVKNPVNATPLQTDPVPAAPLTPGSAKVAVGAKTPAIGSEALPPKTAAPVARPRGTSVAPGARPAAGASSPATPAPSATRVTAGPRDSVPATSRPARTRPTVAPNEPRENATIELPLGPPIRTSGTPAAEPRDAVPTGLRPAKVKPPAPQPATRRVVRVPDLRAVPRASRREPTTVAPTVKAEQGSGRVPLPVYIVRPVTDMAVRSRNYVVSRGDRLSQIARRHGVTPQSILVANGLKNGKELRAGARLVIPGTFSVAMNDQPVRFDVSPRMDGQIPVAPFRHIFEHAGGSVVWHPEDRSVTARKPEKEIRIEIGSDKAMVNQAVVIMDRAAFIDTGRTMLPMRFMSEALDMKAEYDPRTGTIYLTRKEPKLASAVAP
jgi:LysM repeat protein